MNRRFKLTALIISGVMVSTFLFGCGGKSKDNSDDKEIVVWSNLMDNEVDEVNKIAQQWARENNKKVKVVQNESGFQGFLQAANSEEGPDMLFGLPHNNLGTFYEAGLLEEVPKDFVNKNDYLESNLWEAVSYEGKPYAVPISMETYALFYNKDKIKKVPDSMEDLIEDAKNYGKKGFQFPINDFYYTAAFIQTCGGYVFGEKNGKVNVEDIGLNNEGAVKAYKFLQDLVQKDKFMAADITQDIASTSFKNGEAVYYIGGPWDIQGFKKAGINFGVVPIPKFKGKNIKSFMGVQSAFVSSKSKYKEKTWKLLKYLIDNSSKKLYEVGNRIPVLKSELSKAEVGNNEYTNGFVKQISYAVPMPNISETQLVWEPVKNIQRILNGEDAKTVADDIEKRVKDAIEVSK